MSYERESMFAGEEVAGDVILSVIDLAVAQSARGVLEAAAPAYAARELVSQLLMVLRLAAPSLAGLEDDASSSAAWTRVPVLAVAEGEPVAAVIDRMAARASSLRAPPTPVPPARVVDEVSSTRGRRISQYRGVGDRLSVFPRRTSEMSVRSQGKPSPEVSMRSQGKPICENSTELLDDQTLAHTASERRLLLEFEANLRRETAQRKFVESNATAAEFDEDDAAAALFARRAARARERILFSRAVTRSLSQEKVEIVFHKKFAKIVV